jgi:hypothetical protein
LLVTNWSNFGVYDIRFGDDTPAHFTPAGDVPVPWLSALVEGPGNEGLLYSGYFPMDLAARIDSEEGRARLHRFRASASAVAHAGIGGHAAP